MPIYTYLCENGCGEYDELHLVDTEPSKKCKFCGKAVRKIMAPCAFSLKGSGFPGKEFKEQAFKADTSDKAMKEKGYIKYADRWGEQAKIEHNLYKRRQNNMPIDGNCFKEAGKALEEARYKDRRSRGTHVNI